MYINFLIPQKHRAKFWKYGFYFTLIMATYLTLFINIQAWIFYPLSLIPYLTWKQEGKKQKK